MVDKTALLDSLRERVAADLEALARRQKDAQAGATHDESRAEHAKDTRATITSSSYRPTSPSESQTCGGPLRPSPLSSFEASNGMVRSQ